MRMLLLGVAIGVAMSALAVAVPLVLAQSAPPIQEFIPLPGPGQQQPGQRPGQQQGQEECQTILLYHNGQLYQLSPGPQDGQGRPGSPPEFFYLNPYRGPTIPGFPQPQRPQPNFKSVLPRS